MQPDKSRELMGSERWTRRAVVGVVGVLTSGRVLVGDLGGGGIEVR